MKVFLIFIAVILIVFVVIFLAASIIEGSFNIFNWREGPRVTCVIVWLCVGTWMAANIADDYIKK